MHHSLNETIPSATIPNDTILTEINIQRVKVLSVIRSLARKGYLDGFPSLA